MLINKMVPRLIITAPSSNISNRRDGLANSYETASEISFFSKLNLSGTMDPKDFLSEAHIMKRLRHPKLIQVWLARVDIESSLLSLLHFSSMPSAL